MVGPGKSSLPVSGGGGPGLNEKEDKMTQVAWIPWLSGSSTRPQASHTRLPEERKLAKDRSKDGQGRRNPILGKGARVAKKEKESPGIQSLPRTIKTITWASLSPVPRKP